ncbi:E3 ubiquitin-protein ligase XIAP [Hypomesus transpacificus]|uniref:E3 ubiquitin-protein ligase XIAP n=1 Tax=Hypomesus transpacificus TaxID=137520 RepID=UPI001F078695|nr:E3 ubiquitin-protein ligase XIAP [Hypomesus transpacificus]
MSGLRGDSDLEADHSIDWSMMDSRLDSFRGSTLAQQVSVERLARAGFYFTGHADRVRCFSCQKTVENWCGGDTPVERHLEVSPTCKFLSCTYRYNVPALTNGSPYNEEAEDREFRLRTGEVVDESTYPIAPQMSNEDSRLRTFDAWRSETPVRPLELAQAGFYSTGESDRVLCFCCGGMLSGWEAGDTAWGEHSKYFPNCYFILGHDVGNVPSQGAAEEEGVSRGRPGPYIPMESFEERLGSFAHIQVAVDPERLARAGFYSTGAPDKVSCFRCGGGLKGWQPEEDPWEEHAKHYPGCSFLLAEKGPEFVNNVQLQSPQRNTASRHHNGFSSHGQDPQVLLSPMAQKALEMGLEGCLVEKTILGQIQKTGDGYSTLEALLHDCFKGAPDSESPVSNEQEGDDPLEKLRKLQREKQCKVCMDRDTCIVFIPCGHLVTCKECSESLSKCPICCGTITQKIKTYS